MVPEFNDACFSGKIGELQVVASQFGIHLIEVKKSKSVKKVKIAFIDRNVFQVTKRTRRYLRRLASLLLKITIMNSSTNLQRITINQAYCR